MAEIIRVLCVDDERPILNAIRRQLFDEDYEVHTALTAEEGLGILRRIRPVHVVLSDYRMPGMNGVEFLSILSRDWPGSVGIILSGFAVTPDMKQAMEQLDLFAFLAKPWKADEMRKTVADAIALSHIRLGKAQGRR